jgi:probable F420-dependent oxidoreductase
MQLGALLPLGDIGGDPATVREYAQAAEAIGYGFVEAPDHVLGASEASASEAGRTGAGLYHDPFVLFGYLAGCTSKLGFSTGVLILPQRQTVLVAKQAAEIDLLTGGRFRLGVGIGWNAVEFEALGQRFGDRGARFEEQIELMRRLWTEPSLSFEGRYEHVTGTGIRPLPVQRPIPVWIGASVDVALARAGRLADGWFPQAQPGPALEHAIAVVHGAAAQAGRDPAAIGMEGRVQLAGVRADGVADRVRAWREAGATHVGISTMGAGLATVEDHVAALRTAAEALALRR